METSPNGVFKGNGITLNIVQIPKDMSDIVNVYAQGSQPAIHNLATFFNRQTAASVGKCTLTSGDQTLNADCAYSRNILTLTDAGGYRTCFCYLYDKLYMLDPEGSNTIVLSRQ